MKINFKIKLYPISEDGEEVYHGGFIDVLSVDFLRGAVTTYSEYTNPHIACIDYILSRRQLDEWFLYDNRDERDKQTELWRSIDDGEYELVNLDKYIE